MSVAKTGIEWTNSTWNPTTGCTEISAGCDNCYAAGMARTRLRDAYGKRLPVVESAENIADPFAVRLWPERLVQPERWHDARMIFVNSMSDLWHVDVPDEYVRRIFEVMLRVDRHTYQVLTKRPARAAKWIQANADLFSASAGRVPAHIWIGTSVESQEVAYRIAHLRSAPAAIRFLSCEPLLGPIEFPEAFDRDIQWVIVGGESGSAFRRMDPEWARSIRDQCTANGVAFFFKQWSGASPKSYGRELDGREWNEFPEVEP